MTNRNFHAGRDAPLRMGAALRSGPLRAAHSLKLRQRHLDEFQRVMVATRLATLRNGQRQVGQLAHVLLVITLP